MSRKPNSSTAWESYGAFKGRRGKQDDAMACFDVALSVSDKMCVSASLRKAAILIDRNEIEFAVRILSNIDVKTAAQYASMAVTRGLRCVSTMILLANSFVKHGDDDTAKSLLRRVLSNDKVYSKEAIMLWKAIKVKNKKK